VSRDAGAGRAYLQILDAVILQRAGHPRILEERDAVLQPRAPQACHKNDRCGGNRILGASAVRAQNSSPPRGWCFTLEVCGVRTEMSFFFISGVVMTGAAGVGVAARVEEQRSVVRSVRLRHPSDRLAPRAARAERALPPPRRIQARRCVCSSTDSGGAPKRVPVAELPAAGA
jgi:hypothetical protein